MPIDTSPEVAQEVAQDQDVKDGKQKRNHKPKYEVPEGGLREIPTDWNDDYRPLRRNDFYDECMWYDWRIGVLNASVARLTEQRDKLAKLGSVEQRKKTAGVLRMREKLMKQAAELQAEGIDLSELLGGLVSDDSEE